MAGPDHRPVRHQAEEAGEVEIGDHDHHAEKQHDRLHVDSLEGFLRSEDTEGDHQRRAEQGRPRSVEQIARQFADRDDDVGCCEDQNRWDHAEFCSALVPAAPAPGPARINSS